MTTFDRVAEIEWYSVIPGVDVKHLADGTPSGAPRSSARRLVAPSRGWMMTLMDLMTRTSTTRSRR